MNKSIATFAAVLAATAVIHAPQHAEAQSGDGWWEWAAPSVVGGQEVPTRRGPVLIPGSTDRDRDARTDDRRGTLDPRSSRDRDRNTRRGPGQQRGPGQAGRGQGARGQGQGPPFCRNGQGHPVHGRAWCDQKGWSRAGGWGDVIFRTPQERRRGMLDQGGLLDTLGDIVFGRLDGQRQRAGASGPLQGRWVQDRHTGASILQVRAGDHPLAEFTDLDGDGRVDLVLTPER